MLDEKSSTELMADIVKRVSEVMGLIDLFEASRPGSMAFTKLEEAIMWLQVMVHNVALKPANDNNLDEKKQQIASNE